MEDVVTKGAEYQTTKYLERLLVCLDKVDHQSHREGCHGGIDHVREGRPESAYKAVPTTFGEGALDAEHADGAHRSRHQYAYNHPRAKEFQ